MEIKPVKLLYLHCYDKYSGHAQYGVYTRCVMKLFGLFIV